VTTAELITAGLRYYSSAGNPTIAQDVQQRQRAHYFLTKTAKWVWDAAPWWFRLNDGSVVLSSGVGTLPTDFSRMGTQGKVYIQGQLYRPLTYKPPDYLKFQIQNTPQTGTPWVYTLYGKTALGIPKILTWPQDNSTLVVLGYTKRMPELIDAPLAPVLTAASGGALAPGARTGSVTFVTADGETEGGFVSASASTSGSNLQYAWTAIPTWWGRTVTSRKLYRTLAGGLQRKLVTTLSDNLTTTYTDNIADGALTTNEPLPAAAVTGVEVFPEQFLESALYDGLVFLLARTQGDNRDQVFSMEWKRAVQRQWEEIQEGQGEINVVGRPFPGFAGGHPVWSRWSVPS